MVQVIAGSIDGRPSAAQHAILKLPDQSFIDAGGRGTQEEVVAAFVKGEIQPWGGTFQLESVRDFLPGDLPDAPSDSQVIDAIVGAWNAPTRGRRNSP